MKPIHIVCASAVLGALISGGVAAAQDGSASLTGNREVEQNFGSALEGAGGEVKKNSPDGKAVANNFGEALEGAGQVVGRGIGSLRGVGNNFGEALEGAGDTLVGDPADGAAEPAETVDE
ncbi:MAG: hypothetical protein KDD44_02680 [Bdellovibrionales bacterium]|nr:hypothetical protein [Bdellovibrionales bacterium]